MSSSLKISVVGLGYVGLPLAVALARHYAVTGFDIDRARIAELEAGADRTGEVDPAALADTTLALSAAPDALNGSDLFIVTVPTPVDSAHAPDLTALLEATRLIAAALRPGAVVAYESTVYPGVTEDICGPALEAASGLRCGVDFQLGYSPERINPGDRAHSLERITKVVAGQTAEVTELLAGIYGSVNGGDIFRAADIRTAEAAKVIENAQRDINIAFINEVSLIFNRLGLSVHDVLAAARTKWNFLDFKPGLVGGHCIGVDPFYLAHCAKQLGHDPEVILSGRRINESMGRHLAARLATALADRPGGRILVLGLTFKENIPDIRNSKVADLVAGLRAAGHEVELHDPLADAARAEAEHGLALIDSLAGAGPYDCVVAAVAHAAYRGFDAADIGDLLAPGGLVFDLHDIWRDLPLPAGSRRLTL
jgi:UDP-N-acetyl-D-galactosamine dehydrogenase